MSSAATLPPPAPAVPVGGARSSWRAIVLWLALGELLLLYGPTIAWLFDRWTMSVWQHAHGLLIPPVAGYLVYEELRRRAALPVRSSAWGFAVVVPALALHALDTGIHTQLLSAVSLVMLLPGLSLLVLGADRTRAILFPLAFLAFSLPIPLTLTEPLHWQLRQIATAAAGAISPMLGIPVFVEGTTLHLARGSLQVADACSGFSTLYAAMAVACLMAYTLTSTARRVTVLAAAAPIAIAANVLRVIALVIVVDRWGSGVLDTFVHPLSGVLTFVLALPVIFWLGGEPAGRDRT